MCGFAALRAGAGCTPASTANVPRAFTPCMRSKRFIGVSTVPARQMALALFTSTSMPPKRSTAAPTAAAISVLVADVARDGERLAAGRLDLLGGGVDRPRQLRVRHGRSWRR